MLKILKRTTSLHLLTEQLLSRQNDTKRVVSPIFEVIANISLLSFIKSFDLSFFCVSENGILKIQRSYCFQKYPRFSEKGMTQSMQSVLLLSPCFRKGIDTKKSVLSQISQCFGKGNDCVIAISVFQKRTRVDVIADISFLFC